MKTIWNFIVGLLSKLNKYWVTVIAFLIIMFCFSEYTFIDRIKYSNEIKQLENDIEKTKKLKRDNQARLNALKNGVEGLEKIAREQYQMSAPDEDIFIIEQ
jgi:cell division protein FtsB